VRFAVIEGSREWTEPVDRAGGDQGRVQVEQVHAEARRRLRALKLDEWRVREFVTGNPMPDAIRHQSLQIEFAAQAISRLSPIPDDYADDVYWPHVW
jgi:hypothetical protein